jgi:hypothetical protein
VNRDNLGEENINDFATKDETVEIAFSPTPCSQITGTTIVAPKFLDQQKQFVLPNCRLLYASGTATINTVDDSFTPTNATVYTLNHYSTTLPVVDDLDLNFAPENPLYSIPVSPYNTIWFRFWSKYFRELYDKGSRIMEAYFNLTSVDVFNLSFADKIWIQHESFGSSWWRILEVQDHELSSNNQSTKVKLIRILDLGLGCQYTPDSRLTNGQIQFRDPDGNPVDGSRECCLKYGYIWNEELGICQPQSQSNSSGRRPLLNNFEDPQAALGFKNLASNVVNVVTSEYQVATNDSIVNVDTSAAGTDVNINLPTAESMLGKTLVVINIDGLHNVDVNAYGSESMGTKSSERLKGQNEKITLTSTGIGWSY